MPRYRDMAPDLTVEGQTAKPGLVHAQVLYAGEEVFYRVQAGEQARLDLISTRFYGTPDYFWVIAAHNQIKDTLSIDVGDLLRIPVDLSEVLRLLEGQWE